VAAEVLGWRRGGGLLIPEGERGNIAVGGGGGGAESLL